MINYYVYQEILCCYNNPGFVNVLVIGKMSRESKAQGRFDVSDRRQNRNVQEWQASGLKERGSNPGQTSIDDLIEVARNSKKIFQAS